MSGLIRCNHWAKIGDVHDFKTFVFPPDTFFMARQGRTDAPRGTAPHHSCGAASERRFFRADRDMNVAFRLRRPLR